jgi:hypothetical protein
MRRAISALLLAALLALPLSGCGDTTKAGVATDAALATSNVSAASTPPREPFVTSTLENQSPAASPESSASASRKPGNEPDQQLKQAAQDVMDILRERDLERLTGFIDPEQGLRFSPYSHIDVKTSMVFQAEDLPAFTDSGKLTWGASDGSGEAIELTFRDYFEKFVYDRDFAGAPDISINNILGTGNMVFNGRDIYQGASFVEFHFPGFDKKHEGMDWESLVLVFRPAGTHWKLCAIVHGQWTI